MKDKIIMIWEQMKPFLSSNKIAIRNIILGAIAGFLVILCFSWIKNNARKEEAGLPMENTIATIEDIRPRGEIYVCSSIIEDYAIKTETEHNIFTSDKEHSCVQTMVNKCSYKIDLDRVEYNPIDSLKLVRVKIPEVTYVATTQDATFLSDDPNYWAEHMPNADAMKTKVEKQIKKRFDTPSNRKKAERYAEDAISHILQQMGYEVEFIRTIEQVRD